MHKYLLVIVLSLGNLLNSYSQNSRLSLDLGAGFPLSLTLFSPALSTYGTASLKYNLFREVAIGAKLNVGTINGSNPNALAPVQLEPSNYSDQRYYKGFSTDFFQYQGYGTLDLGRVFRLRNYKLFNRLNPYLSAGGGMISVLPKANRVDGADRAYPRQSFYTAFAGLQFKYYINPQIDFFAGTEFNYVESFFLDGFPEDKKKDQFMLTNVGISYKFGGRKDRQNIEWNNVILKDRIYIPDIEKRQGQPLDEAGNYFVFHKDSIQKLQNSNAQLIEQTNKQQEQITKQQEQIDKQQKQIDQMLNEMNGMKTRFDTIQKQIDEIKASKTQVVYQQVEVEKPSATKKNKKNTRKPKAVSSSNQQTDEGQPQKDATNQTGVEKTSPDVKSSNSSSNKNVSEKNESLETASTTELNKIDGIVAPVARYNVVVGAYTAQRYAYRFRDRLRNKGFDAAIFKSDIDSKVLRVCAFSTTNKAEALRMMRKVRKDIDAQAWIHVYYEK